MKLILASQSPRRAELLKKAGYEFEVFPSAYKENNLQNKAPRELVKEHALNKARSVAGKISEGLVLGADTLVVIDNKILSKPKSANEAKKAMGSLSNKVNEVITGIALIDAKTKKELVDSNSTKVKFKKLSDKEIDEYFTNLKSPLLGFAAGYAIQEMNKNWVKKIEGSYSNVVGLPMEKLKEMLKQFKH